MISGTISRSRRKRNFIIQVSFGILLLTSMGSWWNFQKFLQTFYKKKEEFII